MAEDYARVQAGQLLWLVAEAEGFLAGDVRVYLTSPDPLPGFPRATFFALGVYPPLQNRGIGTALVRAVEQALRERGYRWVGLAWARTIRTRVACTSASAM